MVTLTAVLHDNWDKVICLRKMHGMVFSHGLIINIKNVMFIV